jgi:N-formylglutamate deformylase
MDVFKFHQGSLPLLVSIPHSGVYVPESIHQRQTKIGHQLIDTDWHIPELYSFLEELDCSVIEANYSRYVVDLNRPPDNSSLYPGKKVTGICSAETFMGQRLYIEGEEPNEEEIKDRKNKYWVPYHEQIRQELTRIKNKFGYALLWDAHSIRGFLPLLFEGDLPDLNLGTGNGQSCDAELSNHVYSVMRSSTFEVIRNGRFKGGYITRNYGNPEKRVHALQMEISQEAYMSGYPSFELVPEKVATLRPLLKKIIVTLLDNASNLNGNKSG